ncbi:hypothetical protein MVES1_001152 [Malassezia vespertilionis]|uniref:uncharacterized protein n=1 Tax=Malassezia vespertilionis TaxID=2020962 RepID=UPI0024B1C728|nr:uncharacterized protein MVES1_001152 [Malassezia vespertilionis]WFD05818.1 hypothetical protein MVES1_001152 [Malassezia vespertilionis]
MADAVRAAIQDAYECAVKEDNGASLEAAHGGGFLPEDEGVALDNAVPDISGLPTYKLRAALSKLGLSRSKKNAVQQRLFASAEPGDEGLMIPRDTFARVLEVVLLHDTIPSLLPANGQDEDGLTDSEEEDEFLPHQDTSDEEAHVPRQTRRGRGAPQNARMPNSAILKTKARFLYRLLLERIPLKPGAALDSATNARTVRAEIEEDEISTRRIGLSELRYAATSLGEKQSTTERLRQAASQRSGASNKSVHATPDGAGKSSNISSSSGTSEADQAPKQEVDATTLSPTFAESTTPREDKRLSQSAPTASTNVWENRMKQRQAQMQRQKTPLADSTPNLDDKPADAPVLACAQSSVLPIIPSDNASVELGGADAGTNDAWIHRIQILNGGRNMVPFCRSPESARRMQHKKGDAPAEKNSDATHHAENGLPLLSHGSQPHLVNAFGNMCIAGTSVDGSFSPLRQSDPHRMPVPHFITAPPPGYMPAMPYQAGMDMHEWQRRDNRALRAAGRGRGNQFGMQQEPSTPQLVQKMLPCMFVPGSGMVPMPNGPLSNTVHRGDERTAPRASPEVTRASRSDTSLPHSESTSSDSMGSPHVSAPYIGTPGMMPPGYVMQPNMMHYPMLQSYGQMDMDRSLLQHPHGARNFVPLPAQSCTLDSPTLLQQLLLQIEFYFSESNLELDFFLRQQMDAEGYASFETLAKFKRVQMIFNSATVASQENALSSADQVALLQRAVAPSTVLQTSEDEQRIRRRCGWEKYVIH